MFLPLLLAAGSAAADTVTVRHIVGLTHGFLRMETLEGKMLATGDLIQTVSGNRVTSRLTFHFRDGSLDDETTVFTQNRVLKLISDHHVQKGPSFPAQLDMTVTGAGQVTVKSTDKDGKEKQTDEHMDLPADIANGLPLTVLLNLKETDAETKLPLLLFDGKPQLVTLAIRPEGTASFTVGGAHKQANRFAGKIEIGGIKGVIAPIVGKEPKELHFWFAAGEAPVFLQSEAQLFAGGPAVRIRQVIAVFQNTGE